MEAILKLPIQPVHINSHSGSDHFDDAESRAFFSQALAIEKELGLTVSHETHRGRILSNPFRTERLLQEFPLLKVTLDLSHWVLVCERQIPLDDPALDLVMTRTWHIHARVGTPQHAQVAAPRDANIAEHTAYFDSVWSRCIQQARKAGDRQVSLTPEYGPTSDLYMPDAVRIKSILNVCGGDSGIVDKDVISRQVEWVNTPDDYLEKLIVSERVRLSCLTSY